MTRPSWSTHRLIAAAILILLVTDWTQAQHINSRPKTRPVQESARAAEEREQGRVMFTRYMTESSTWPGERVNEFVNRLGQNLARATDSPALFTFRVVQSPYPGAEAFPGGFVAVNSGIIALAESEAELAAVLSHEIAHINASHGRRHRNRLGVFSLAAMVPLMVGGGPVGWVAFLGSAVVAPLVDAKFSRSFEQEADELSVHYLTRAGYDPNAAVTLLERYATFQAREGSARRGLLCSHPLSTKRALRLRRLIQRATPSAGMVVQTSEFESIRQEVLDHDRKLADSFGAGLSNDNPRP
jgi:predicted Zn-dependent protease